ncbi:hypothetical protein [Halomonas sp. YLGW01]|uniref:hypothetical protein n=1 Tax=Halomonas sp. YLGW01 TaxID=2773308 RepID=UPI00177DE87D|nr:hypothetical protein [Halomonas sp. YLGW01]
MHLRDCGTWPRAALAPSLVIALTLGGSPAGAPSLYPTSLAGQASSIAPISASLRPATDPADTTQGSSVWRHGQAEGDGSWHGQAERDPAEAAACGHECLKRLRLQLLEHHREAAPIWVF